MALRLTNTMTGKKEEFVPLRPGQVRLYVCGVTVYDMCHIGHARSGVVFDVIARWLRHSGWQLEYVKNFTDVDDKIIKRANEAGVDPSAITEKYIREYYTDMDALGLLRPDHEPRVTEPANMQAIIGMIDRLMRKGLAYPSGGDVYYRVRRFTGYGKLSGKNIEELEIGARIAPGEAKEDALDFALWKAAKPGEPWWESPWGRGRPGWHIECSAMSCRLLGEHFDLHGGGHDLIFPHHENEIAQAEGANGVPFANYWLHNGFVNINAEKMSKSLRNFVTIRDILAAYPAEVIRYFLIASHYRSPVDFTEKNLQDSRRALGRLYATLARLSEYLAQPMDSSALDARAGGLAAQAEKMARGFSECMDDDINTAGALGHFFEAATEINRFLDKTRGRDPAGSAAVETFHALYLRLGWVLGLLQQPPAAFLEDLKHRALAAAGWTEADVLSRIADRQAAKAAKDYAQADSLRNDLLGKGIVLKDTPRGTVWEAE